MVIVVVLLHVIYAMLIFFYMTMRIVRDVLMMGLIGPIGTCTARILSFICVPIYLYLQKQLLKKFSLKQVSLFNLLLFSIYCLLFKMHLIPIFNFSLLKNKFFVLRYFFTIVEHIPETIFYILSECFAVFITTFFWMNVNQSIGKCKESTVFKNFFIFAQISVILTAIINIIHPNLQHNILILTIGLPILSILFLFVKHKYNIEHISTHQDDSKPINNNKDQILIYTIPIITILCGLTAGFIDNFTKNQIKMITYSHTDYHQLLSIFWLIQSILSIIFNKIFKNWNQLITLPLFNIMSFLFILILPYNQINSFSYFLIFSVLMFKGIKYSIHSPVKERLINNANNSKYILFTEGLVSRSGKNLSAIVLFILFSIGFQWYEIYKKIFIILICLSIVWSLIVLKIQSK